MRSQIVTSSLQPGESKTDFRNRSQTVTGSQKHRDPRFLPWVFTEYGALMAANLLRSGRAVQTSVHVVRAFVRLLVNSNAVHAFFESGERLGVLYQTQYNPLQAGHLAGR